MASPTATDVYGTSAWQVGNAGLIPKFSSILQKYGIVPDAATLSKYGLSSLFDPNSAAGAAANPNSVYAQLGRARDTGYETNMHTAQGHGALFSGAFVNSQDETGRGYARGLGQAGQDELSDLLGVGGEQGNLYQTIYGQLLSAPTDADPTVYQPPAPAREADRAGGSGVNSPNWNPWHIRQPSTKIGDTSVLKPTGGTKKPKLSTTLRGY